MAAAQEGTGCLAVGRLRIFPRQRRILAGDQPVELGSRAFDLLLTLIEARGTTVSRSELMSRVWPNLIVADNNLDAQISALRKAFGADRGLIRTVAGRGYQFTSEPSPPPEAGPREAISVNTPATSAPAPTNLPAPVSDLIGRDVEVQEILHLAGARRLVTLTGAGGIGKTRLAHAVARQLLSQFPDGVWVAELSSLNAPDLVPAAVAAAVGLELTAGEASAERVAAALGAKSMLIVLDTCEHVIDAAAGMAEALLRSGAGVRVIATSREELKADGEWVYRVGPLSVAADDVRDPRDFDAGRLFVSRAQWMGLELPMDRRSAATIAAISRRLDGIPLAIELAAARAAALGIAHLAKRIDDHLQLLTCGRRTALPRHQSWRATLDWSYRLLTQSERAVLRRLAMFRGNFGLDAARAVAADEGLSSDVTDDLANLVAKSLVSAEINGSIPRYRLFETTRAYALEKLAESGEVDAAARRYAEYSVGLCKQAEVGWETHPAAERVCDQARPAGPLHAAGDWAITSSATIRAFA